MISALTFSGTRRAKFLVLVTWILIAMVGGSLAGKFESAQKNDPGSYLPGDAESVKVLDKVEGFPSGSVVPAVIVYRREGGLTAADRTRVERDRRSLAADPPVSTTPPRRAEVSRDGTTALLVAPIRAEDDSDNLVDATDDIRERVGEGSGGLAVRVTGAAGFSTDAIKVFEQINGTLLLATLALVFVLLILIYRSPIFWLVPFLSVVFAEAATNGLGYALTELGVTVNGQSAGILPVLVFGAGTDYALLIVARYREELRHEEDKHVAVRTAMRKAGPAIFASGLTVIAALLTLSLAEVNGTAGMGPIGAMGIALAMLAMLTILPALLAIVGRRAFWPFVPHVGDEGADETHGFWRRVGERVAVRPRRVWVGVLVVLAVMASGLVFLNSDLTTGNGFRDDVESVEGQELLSTAFPSGANAPAEVVVGDTSRVTAVRAALATADGVAAIGPVERGRPGARFDVVRELAPYSSAAFDRIDELRRAAHQAGGDTTLVGGPSAEERDLRESAVRDNRLLVPIALAVVFVILAVLLRALLAPLLLIGTVVVSFLASLGVASFLFEKVFGFEGMDPTLPLFAFVFLVALGVDYNIFLMARVREEAVRQGTRHGMLRGLAVTGAVITSAGVVLAGTFSALAILPLVALTQIGFTIAFGVLLDTFLVRSLLVPALVFDIGPRVWWPSTLSHSIERRGKRMVDERETEAEAEPAGVG